MGRKEETENFLIGAYHSPDKTIEAVSKSETRSNKRSRAQNMGRRVLATQVKKSQVHPMLWQWLRENGPKTEGGHIDRSVLHFEPDNHVTPDSETIDSVIIYDSPEQKQAAES